jgi:diguanylate cyclase (GGDEF)-like protein
VTGGRTAREPSLAGLAPEVPVLRSTALVPIPPPLTTPMQGLSDLLLTTDSLQRVRLSQALLAMALMAASVVAMHYFVWVGEAPASAVWVWTVVSLGGMVVVYGLVRSGWSRRLADPSMSVPQMMFALASGAAAYALVGAGRGGVFPIVMVILMFGMFAASPRQLRWISVYAVALFGAVMGVMAWRQPAVYDPKVELGHFIMIAVMMPAASILAARLSRMRHRARLQRVELREALARIRELATHDELTGLINRSHMQSLMAQEHQRCIRSGQTFCVAMFDVDGLKAVNTQRGRAAGDAVLRGVAQEALRQVRACDLLSRWAGGTFVLLIPDSRSALARGGLERMRERLAVLPLAATGVELVVTVSAGLVEHHAGEDVAHSLQRAEAALAEAKSAGRNRVQVAS